MSYLRAAAKLAAMMAWALPLAAVQAWVAGPVFKDHETIPRLLKRGVRKILGISVEFNGAAKPQGPTIYAANHTSYLDIILLGSELPGTFVSKSDIKKWPVVGWMSKTVGTIFTDRTPFDLRRTHGEMADVLNRGGNVIMFPEATTSNGDNGGIPFKRGMLCVAFRNVSKTPLERDVLVQPVSMRLTSINGKDVGECPELRRDYSWCAGENIVSNFLFVAAQKEIKMVMTAHPPMDPKDYTDSRAFTKEVERTVHAGVRGDHIPPPSA